MSQDVDVESLGSNADADADDDDHDNWTSQCASEQDPLIHPSLFSRASLDARSEDPASHYAPPPYVHAQAACVSAEKPRP